MALICRALDIQTVLAQLEASRLLAGGKRGRSLLELLECHVLVDVYAELAERTQHRLPNLLRVFQAGARSQPPFDQPRILGHTTDELVPKDLSRNVGC